MKCKDLEKLLPLYLDNELTVAQKQVVEEHLKTCLSCAATLSRLKKVSTLLAQVPQLEVSSSLQARLYAIPALTQEKVSAGTKVSRLLGWLLSPSLQTVLAAVSIVLVIISFFFFHPDGQLLGRSINEKFHQGYGRVEKLLARAEGLPGYLPGLKESVENSLKNINLSLVKGEENN